MTRDLGTYSTIRSTSRRPLRRTRYSKSTVFTLNVPDMPWLGLGPPGRCRAKSRHRCLAFCLCSLDRFQPSRSFPLHLLACERYQMPPPTASLACGKQGIYYEAACTRESNHRRFVPGVGLQNVRGWLAKTVQYIATNNKVNFLLQQFSCDRV